MFVMMMMSEEGSAATHRSFWRRPAGWTGAGRTQPVWSSEAVSAELWPSWWAASPFKHTGGRSEPSRVLEGSDRTGSGSPAAWPGCWPSWSWRRSSWSRRHCRNAWFYCRKRPGPRSSRTSHRWLKNNNGENNYYEEKLPPAEVRYLIGAQTFCIMASNQH